DADFERTLAGESSWPSPLTEAAYCGLAGDFVGLVGQESEADPAALCVQFLAHAGAVIGRAPFYRVEATDHHARLYPLLVGPTAKARKGTSADHVHSVFECAQRRVVRASGLSSGEGVLWKIRDEIWRKQRNKKTGEIEEVIVDDGVEDKRLLIVESEFAQVLAV